MPSRRAATAELGARGVVRGGAGAFFFVLLLLCSLVGQSALARAIPPVEIWNGGIYDDAPQADIPMVSSEIAAVLCVSARICAPAQAMGSVIGLLTQGPSPLLLEVSRPRGPPSRLIRSA